MSIFTLAPAQIVTPAPVPVTDPPPVGWATGSAANAMPSAVTAFTGPGVGLSGVPGEPFADGPGGSTFLAQVDIPNRAKTAIAGALAAGRSWSLRTTFQARIDRPLPRKQSSSADFSDGWMCGLLQDRRPLPDGVGYGLYTDAIHVPIWRGMSGEDFGQLSANWETFRVAADGATDAIDLERPVQILFLAEQSTEPQSTAWTLLVRALRLTIETRSA